MKKFLIIIIPLIIILAIILFFVFTRGEETSETGEQENGFLDFLFPGSDNKPIEQGGTDIGQNGEQNNGNDMPIFQEGALIKLTNISVSGAVYNEKTSKINYFEKETGHVYAVTPQGTEREQLTTNRFINLGYVKWTGGAGKAVVGYSVEEEGSGIMERPQYFVLTSISSTTEGYALPINTLAAVPSPDEKNIFYLAGSGQTEVKGIIDTFDNLNKEQIFSLPYGSFLLEWAKKDLITLLTKPSASSEGFLYGLDPKTKSFSKIMGNIKGLTTLSSPFSDYILFSESIKDSITTKYTSNGTAINMPVKTFPEKCLFSQNDKDVVYCAVPKKLPSASYPDAWYKGDFFFDDQIWRISLVNGSKTMVFNKEGFDIVNLFTNNKENYLFFINKIDGHLWSFGLDTQEATDMSQ